MPDLGQTGWIIPGFLLESQPVLLLTGSSFLLWEAQLFASPGAKPSPLPRAAD